MASECDAELIKVLQRQDNHVYLDNFGRLNVANRSFSPIGIKITYSRLRRSDTVPHISGSKFEGLFYTYDGISLTVESVLNIFFCNRQTDFLIEYFFSLLAPKAQVIVHDRERNEMIKCIR